MIKVALLCSDGREVTRNYNSTNLGLGPAPQALIEGFALLPDEVEVHVISCLQKETPPSQIKLADNIYYHGLHVTNIGWLKTGYLGCIRAVRRKLQQIQPDIVHGQGTERDCAMCTVFSGYPNVLTIHGVMRAICSLTNSKIFSYYWFAKHLETLALRRTKGVITISPYVDALVSPYSKQTWFIPNALQLFFFSCLPSQPRRPGPARLVNVGVIGPRKRQFELLERLSRLREEVAFEIIFIGRSSRGSVYNERFKHLLHETNARYGGFSHHEHFPDDKFRDLYDDSDAMIHFSSEESFGLTFAEALARNLPLFASHVGAIRGISKGVQNCQIFDSNDFNGLGSSLRNWLSAKEYLTMRPKTPNAVIASRYHPRVVAAKHLKVYDEILNQKL